MVQRSITANSNLVFCDHQKFTMLLILNTCFFFQTDIRKCTYVSHKFYLPELGPGDLPLGRRPTHQPLAPRDHRSELQYC